MAHVATFAFGRGRIRRWAGQTRGIHDRDTTILERTEETKKAVDVVAVDVGPNLCDRRVSVIVMARI